MQDPTNEQLTCSQAIDALILSLPEMGSIYYALANGWYLGQMGDYATCHGEATNGQFVLA